MKILTEEEKKKMKFHIIADQIVSNWTILTNHSLTQFELNLLVDMLGSAFKAQAIKTHAHGVKVGKELAKLVRDQNPSGRELALVNAVERWINAWASQDTSDAEPARKAMFKAIAAYRGEK